MSPARRDALTEQRIARLEAEGIPPRDPIPQRAPGRFLLVANGLTQDVELRPDPRHCWKWIAVMDGQVIERGGLDRIFRELQRQRRPILGSRSF